MVIATYRDAEAQVIGNIANIEFYQISFARVHVICKTRGYEHRFERHTFLNDVNMIFFFFFKSKFGATNYLLNLHFTRCGSSHSKKNPLEKMHALNNKYFNWAFKSQHTDWANANQFFDIILKFNDILCV